MLNYEFIDNLLSPPHINQHSINQINFVFYGDLMKKNFLIVFLLIASINFSTRAQDKFILNVCDINTKDQLHQLLKKTFKFPNYYGMNWDAFIDSMSEIVFERPITVHVEGINNLHKRLPRDRKSVV